MTNPSGSDKKIILIGGGVGPLAGLRLHQLIVENTPDISRDQDHLPVIHLSLSEMIPDRTESLLNQQPHLPAENMAKIIAAAAKTASMLNRVPVAIIACNTFYAPSIWNHFKNAMDRLAPQVTLVHLVNQVVQSIQHMASQRNINKIGIISTTGTHKYGIYSLPLKKSGLTPLEFDSGRQAQVHEAIYNSTWGLKATATPSKKAKDMLKKFVMELSDNGAQLIIPGCTELSLVIKEPAFMEIPVIDPLAEISRVLIHNLLPCKIDK